jgi:hypothetical protein
MLIEQMIFFSFLISVEVWGASGVFTLSAASASRDVLTFSECLQMEFLGVERSSSKERASGQALSAFSSDLIRGSEASS